VVDDIGHTLAADPDLTAVGQTTEKLRSSACGHCRSPCLMVMIDLAGPRHSAKRIIGGRYDRSAMVVVF
jgi:hypothetical protein